MAILSWGGVRGGISLALVLAVANVPQLSEYSSILIGYTFIVVLLSGLVCGLGLPSVMNAFYYNPNEETEGFKGWYQRLCNKMNRKGFKYLVGEDAQGNEIITIYNPEVQLDKKAEDGVASVYHPAQAEEITRLENPNNF